MVKGIIITVIVLGLVVIGVLAFTLIGQDSNNEEKNNPSINYPAPGNVNNNEAMVEEKGNEVGVMENIIEITSSGFSPSTLEINQGETVTFVNRDSTRHWPASDVHPTHTVYPGSGINKCGTSEASMIFDACKGLQQSESYTFTFNEKGRWVYHDHLSPRSKGTIIVN